MIVLGYFHLFDTNNESAGTQYAHVRTECMYIGFDHIFVSVLVRS